MSSSQTFVSETNNYSIYSKWSIVNKGYIDDEYLHYFVQNIKTTRSPIINHGYWIRAEAIREAFQQLLNKNNVIISLGCGFDSSAFRYRQAFFIEFDYRNVCKRKADIIIENNLIEANDILIDNRHLEDENALVLLSDGYILFAGDLNDSSSVVNFLHEHRKMILDQIKSFFKDIKSFDELNVILFNECSLCYILEDKSNVLIREMIKAFIEHIFVDSQLDGIPSINYLGYEMFQSVNCRNGFPIFMLNHFKSLRAPILTFLQEDEIMKRFHDDLCFEDVNIINMKQLLRNPNSMLKQRRQQIIEIEPFDEIEELDNVSSVYALTIATGQRSRKESKALKTNIDTFYKEKDIKKIGMTNCNLNISLFGHCSLFDSMKNCFFIFGGFGIVPSPMVDGNNKQQDKQHQRSSSVLKLSIDDFFEQFQKLDIIKCSGSSKEYQRIHSRVVQLDSNKFILSGGRTSPTKVVSNCIASINDDDENSFTLTTSNELNHCGTAEMRAFRHVFTKFGNEQSRLIQFGGRTTENNANYYDNDRVYLFDLGQMQWKDTKLFGSFKARRHSSAYSIFGADTIIVNGGLDLYEDFVGNQMEVIDQRDQIVRRYDINGLDDCFYSHQLKNIGNNQLLLLGGIGSKKIENLIHCIDMRNLTTIDTFEIDCVDKILMLFNFTCDIIQQNDLQKLFIFGGGGNCFSFGSHFNPTCVVDLKNLRNV